MQIRLSLVPCALALALVACGDEDTTPRGGSSDPSTVSDAGRHKDASTRADAAAETDEPDDEDTDGTDETPPRQDAGRTPRVDAGAADAGVTDAAASKDSGPSAPLGDAGSVSGIDPAELEMLRQVCTDEINMYRATLNVAPLKRASGDRELCSDRGAQKDGIAKVAHGSANSGNPCVTPDRKNYPGFTSQDTCPGWPVGKRGSATIADALKQCLKQMWAEGEPAQGTDQCLKDYFAGKKDCFEAHGHYINMKNAKSTEVSCGFFDMGSMTYWMNQDFR